MGGGSSKVWETSMEAMNSYADQEKKDAVNRGRDEVVEFIIEAAKQLALLSPWGDTVDTVFTLIDGSDTVDEAALKSLLQEVIEEAFQDATLKESVSKFRTSLGFLNQAKTNTNEDSRKSYIFQAHAQLSDAVNTLYQFANIPAPNWGETTAQLFFAYCTIAPVKILALSLVPGTTKEGLKKEIDTILTNHGTLKSKYFDYRKSLMKKSDGALTGYHVNTCDEYRMGLYDGFTKKRWQSSITTWDERDSMGHINVNHYPADPRQMTKHNKLVDRYMKVVGDDVDLEINIHWYSFPTKS